MILRELCPKAHAYLENSHLMEQNKTQKKTMLANGSLDVGEMFRNPPIEVDIKGDFECEPRRTRTSNRLIKRDEPSMLLDANKGDLVSPGQRLSLGYYLIYYLIPCGVGKFVGKMLAKILLLIDSVYRRNTGI